MLHSIACYQNIDSKEIIIIPEYKTIQGFWKETPIYYKLPATVAPEELGDAIFRALQEAAKFVPNPTIASEKPTYTVASGAKSWRKFAVKHSHVIVTMSRKTILSGKTIKLERWYFEKRGYSYGPPADGSSDRKRVCEFGIKTRPEVIGCALIDLFAD